jgi:DNA-binding NarL/FixJ family response regulator
MAAGRPVLRAGLARLLTWTEPGIEVVGEVGTAAEALEACRALRPDVALVDQSRHHGHRRIIVTSGARHE